MRPNRKRSPLNIFSGQGKVREFFWAKPIATLVSSRERERKRKQDAIAELEADRRKAEEQESAAKRAKLEIDVKLRALTQK